MAFKLAISTNKGGVLKTSITTNLAGVLCSTKRVLIIDTDNQGNVCLSFGKNPDELESTLYNVLVEGLLAEQAIITVHPNIDVLPSNDDMTFFEFDVLTQVDKYTSLFGLLKKALTPLEEHYDVILIDTPPNLGLTQGNVLSFADKVLIPFQPENYSMRSLVKIMGAIDDFKKKNNPDLSVLGVLATLVDQRTTLHGQVLQQCRQFCSSRDVHMFETVITRSVRFASSVAYNRLPATLSAPEQSMVNAYFELWKEIEELEAAKEPRRV